MMQPQLLHPSWPSSYNVDYSTHPRTRLYGSHEDSYVRDNYTHSTLVSDFTALFPDVFTELSSLQNDMQILSSLPEGEDPVPCEFEDVCKWLNISDSEWSPSLSVVSSEASFSIAQSSIFPGSGVEVDTQLSLHHLLGAYAEAMENGHEELAEVIVKRIRGKASPLGETLERIAHSLFESNKEDQEGYLRQESIKNFEQAFRAFYQILPCGRFAHFAANSAILEALPNDAETVHIIDFDMGEGVQWPPVIEAMAKKRRALRLTSIKTNHESPSNQWRYEETKRRLYDHAKPFGLNLQIEETSIEELAIETKRTKKKEWLAFNCMFRLPHMATNMPQTSSRAMEFLKIAKQLLAHNSETQTGIIVFAHGESEGCNTSNYTSFFNKKLVHYKSLLESIEWHFPAILSEARIALESIFLAPCINSESWYQDWEQNKIRLTCDFLPQTLSRENLVEAKELVGERESPYRVSIEEQKQNEMILEWRGTPLIRVSTWM
ncbi:PREDICTED: nodulation-signaling pathway 2 protein-like [Ipomoea nil]|uniref:nodulation-signaling pathway 2 protein-like n=1 Tax=Ipomoea nil TaxID=35883 RepID=UPI000901749E|nr:PREDICTED: nodulation-signaling pathway 2 protein-like [Ipomoea nil]